MRITVIGAGNVATHLVRGLAAAGHTVDMVCSRTQDKADALALAVGAQACNDARRVCTSSDAYVIAASDAQIEAIAEDMPIVSGVVMHTSGATSIDALRKHQHRGVLYPCQTFSKADKVDWANVPLLTECATDKARQVITDLARSLSRIEPREATSEQRACLHVAAAMASNFGNHMLTFASEYMERKGLDFDLLLPLMRQTIEKAFSIPPREAQTGPARRADLNTLERHRRLIDNDDMLKIYNAVSLSIMQMYGEHGETK